MTNSPRHKLLRFGFQQFYTNFAWTYDVVAAVVSRGEWKAWGRVAMKFIQPHMHILELAFGPGHLHLALRRAGYHAVGIDLSPQMCAVASSRLRGAGLSNSVARGSVFALPFAAGSFDAVLSTFPTEFIFAEPMQREAWRVLRPGGQMIVIPTVTQRASILSAALRLTRTRPIQLPDIQAHFAKAGFTLAEQHVHTPHANVIVWLLEKPASNQPDVSSRA